MNSYSTPYTNANSTKITYLKLNSEVNIKKIKKDTEWVGISIRNSEDRSKDLTTLYLPHYRLECKITFFESNINIYAKILICKALEKEIPLLNNNCQ